MARRFLSECSPPMEMSCGPPEEVTEDSIPEIEDEPRCDPCSEKGDNIVAEDYCPDCSQYYCPNCSDVHGRLSITRHHVTRKAKGVRPTQEFDTIESTPPPIRERSYKDKSPAHPIVPPRAPVRPVAQGNASLKPSSRPQVSPVPPALKPPKFESRCRFNVKLSNDQEGCDIFGIDITPDRRMFVADLANDKIKVFRTDGMFLSSVYMAAPVSIFVVDNTEALVTHWSRNSFSILDISQSRPFVVKVVTLECAVKSVSSLPNTDKYFVTCLDQPRSVKMVDRIGYVLWSTSVDRMGRQIFGRPLYNTCYVENGRPVVVVSDFIKNSVTKLDGRTGQLIKVNTLKDVQHPGPASISVDTSGGYIFLNYIGSWVVGVRCLDLKLSGAFVLGKPDKGKCLSCVKFDPAERTLYVGFDSTLSGNRNIIEGYRVV